ncbi:MULTISPECIES: serine/threonine-protein kinase [unclassified Mycolicibacterium]|uniref:serine/threonine-protein kinase n=1 Tax=unclassified Mycolicibacterium TaxID=2636767 RepID=UPI002EDB7A37
MPLGAGAKFAGYTVMRLLGSGGMGEVYLAMHPRLPREDALKVLPVEMSTDAEYRARFTREADLAARLWHPHIVGVHDRGEFEGRLWIAMDYVDGTDAARLVREQYPGGMPPTEVAKIINAVAAALDYAHERQLLHRDVKPSNILLTNPDHGQRRIMLADFGVARATNDDTGLTTTNTAVGSVAYTAPEQLTNDPLDGRADQYALAATTYHLLTGAPPFAHSNPAVVIAKRLSSPPPMLSDTHPQLRSLDSVLIRAMTKDPGARFNSCAEFADAFAMGAVLPGLSTVDPPTAPTRVAEPPRPRTPEPPRPEPPPQRAVPPPLMVSGWSSPSIPVTPPPQSSRPAISPVSAKRGRSPLPWILSAVVLVVVVGAIVLAVNIIGGSTTTSTTGGSLTPITSQPASATTTTTTSTPRTPTATAKPPLVLGPDTRNEDCGAGIQLPGQQGWATRAGRGTPETSCFLARSVLESYWAEYPSPSKDQRTVEAAGTVPCSTTGSQCAGDKFVMNCGVNGSDGWITCTGGKNARVYLF